MFVSSFMTVQYFQLFFQVLIKAGASLSLKAETMVCSNTELKFSPHMAVKSDLNGDKQIAI